MNQMQRARASSGIVSEKGAVTRSEHGSREHGDGNDGGTGRRTQDLEASGHPRSRRISPGVYRQRYHQDQPEPVSEDGFADLDRRDLGQGSQHERESDNGRIPNQNERRR